MKYIIFLNLINSVFCLLCNFIDNLFFSKLVKLINTII